MMCGSTEPMPRVSVEDREFCKLPAEIGPCRAAEARYFFNQESGKCEMFLYGGCNGNKNNFEDPNDCMKICDPKVIEL